MRKGAQLLGIIGATLALAVSGCDYANTNTNANANGPVVANANANANANVNTNANVNANANRRSTNANITREEYERDKESWAEEAKRLGRTIGTGANDGWLWTKTRALLAAEDDLRDSTIEVDVDNAVVTLTGTVASAEQKARAAKVSQSVEGVKSVKNSLVVSASGDTNKNANRNANGR